MKPLSRIFFLAVLILVSYIAGTWHARRAAGGNAEASTRIALYYHCPMHPAFRSDQPGTAPCCGMQLEPVHPVIDDSLSAGSRERVPQRGVRISSEKQQIIGLMTEKVSRGSAVPTIRVLGRVALDETRVSTVAPSLDGLIRKVSPIAAGDLVQEQSLIATFQSREILRAQQAYVQALNAADKYQDRRNAEQPESTKAQVQAAEENLEYLGIAKSQIREIARSRKTTTEVEIRSPVSGLLLIRNVFPGTRFERGTELFRIADVTRVWVFADLFENESRLAQAAESATVRDQGRMFPVQMSKAAPQFDPASRTLKIRLALDNRDLLLRPGMFVDVEFKINLPPALTVPVDAIVDSGLKQIVYVDCENGYFEPRQVDTGGRFDDRIEIVRGLAEGERIVLSGNFLIDSESRLRKTSSAPRENQARTLADAKSNPRAVAFDAVCGMPIEIGMAASRVAYQGNTYYFCSERCRRRFNRHPAQFLPAAAAPDTGKSSAKPCGG